MLLIVKWFLKCHYMYLSKYNILIFASYFIYYFFSPIVDNKKSHDTFVQGFSECASEVTSFLNSMPDLESSVQARLLEHLSRCTDIDKRPKEVKARITWNNITDHPKQVLDDRMQCSSTIASQNGVFNKQTECISNLNRTIKPSLNTLGTMHNSLDKVTPCVNTIQNGNSILQTGNVISGLQLVPTRLQSGQMAYIIPTSFVTSTCIPNCVVPMQTSTKLTNTPPAVIPIIDVNTPTHSFSSSSIPLVQTLENKNRRPDISNQGMNDICFVGIQQKMEKNAMASDLKGDPRNSRDIHTDTNCHLTINGGEQDPMWRPW